VIVEARLPSALSHFEPAELLDALSTGILMLDAQLCAIYANVAAQDLLAFSLNQARGRPFVDVIQDGNGLARVLRRALEGGESIAERELTVRPLGATREARVLDVTITPLTGGITGTHLLVELADTTQRQRISREKDLRARLEGSRLMIRQLAHEIRNPLGGLRGAAQLLERELQPQSLKEYTRVIIGEADRLTALVESMAAPGRAPSRSVLNVHEICEHVYHLLRAEAPPSVVIERDYDPSLPEGMLDRHQMIQALLNVARNALQAVSEQGRIVLRTRALSHVGIGAARHRLVASVEVEDDGRGVPEELRASIFYPLVTGRANGSGLGLAVAHELVTRNGGLIEFDSEPGRTVFTLLLPLGELG
jgi:two-component system, NtrC family, nitrogen regulation sensor histidine kinase GlnL